MQLYQQYPDESIEDSLYSWDWTQVELQNFVNQPNISQPNLKSLMTGYFNTNYDIDVFSVHVEAGENSIECLKDLAVVMMGGIGTLQEESEGLLEGLIWIVQNPITGEYEGRSLNHTTYEEPDFLANQYVAVNNLLRLSNVLLSRLDFTMPVNPGQATDIIGVDEQTGSMFNYVNTGVVLVQVTGHPIDFSDLYNKPSDQLTAGRYLLTLNSGGNWRGLTWGNNWIDNVNFINPDAGKYNNLDFSDPQVNPESSLADNNFPEELSLKQQIPSLPEISTPDFSWSTDSSGNLLGFTEETQELVKDVSAELMSQLLDAAVSHYTKKLLVSAQIRVYRYSPVRSRNKQCFWNDVY